MDPLPEIVETPRLTLRRWVAGDGARMGEVVTTNLEHLRPWMPWIATEPLSVEAREELIASWTEGWLAGGDVVFGIFCGDRIVGGTGFHRRVGPSGLEIGYWIDADHVGRGYATEVTRALTDAAFELDGIDRVEIHHDRANWRSRRVPERLGYGFQGESPRTAQAPAETGIDCRWTITRAEWRRIGRETTP